MNVEPQLAGPTVVVASGERVAAAAAGSIAEPVAGRAKLSIVELTKQYAAGLEPAVNRLTMEIEPGHLVALLGPSGCGKTTTLRMVAGLMEPTSGSIVVNGQDITAMPVHKRGMGMVFQSYALFPHMDVLDNVAFGLKMRKVGRDEQRRRAQQALEMVKLGHLAKRRVKELSGGQQQRIALARALVVEPTLLLLDEPLSNLDAKLRESMRAEIRTLQQRSGATTLFVTHDQDEALDMADMIAVMNGGLIEQFGAPREIYRRPRTRFVADFIGRANLVDVEVGAAVGAAADDEVSYRVSAAALGAAGAVGERGLHGKQTTLVLRPHNVRVEPAEDAIPESGIRGQVSLMSYTGDSVGYRIATDAGEFLAEVAASASRLPGVGDAVVVSWNPEDAYLLPSKEAGD
jgi:putative spermidine/putrescine transport system ATP-binding protein